VVGGAFVALDELFFPPLVVENEEGALEFNSEALYEAQLSDSMYRTKIISEREESFAAAALVFIVPPIVILLLGYGIAWVRKGFE
jgi:hypothetical protein